jgi:hypothetical protein
MIEIFTIMFLLLILCPTAAFSAASQSPFWLSARNADPRAQRSYML